jgi:hypothetical protein
VSETATGRKLETARLREMRKRLDSGNYSQDEIEAMGLECLPDVVELCSGKSLKAEPIMTQHGQAILIPFPFALRPHWQHCHTKIV